MTLEKFQSFHSPLEHVPGQPVFVGIIGNVLFDCQYLIDLQSAGSQLHMFRMFGKPANGTGIGSLYFMTRQYFPLRVEHMVRISKDHIGSPSKFLIDPIDDSPEFSQGRPAVRRLAEGLVRFLQYVKNESVHFLRYIGHDCLIVFFIGNFGRKYFNRDLQVIFSVQPHP